MTLMQQILWGSLYLALCLGVELLALVLGTDAINRALGRFASRRAALRVGVVLLVGLGALVVAHTLQAWIWAAAWIAMDALPDWNTAIYFAIVTYSTLGYGDIVLGPDLRVFGAFAAVTGILAFGVSTAYLVAVLTRSLQSGVFGDGADHRPPARDRTGRG